MIQARIASLESYVPPLEGREGMLRLDFNESLLLPPPHVKAAIAQAAKSMGVYPAYGALLSLLAKRHGVRPEAIQLTAGGDGAIALICRALLAPGTTAVIPQPSFGMFFASARLYGASVVSPSYMPGFAYPLPEVLAAIDDTTRLVVVCTPNNPTGDVTPGEAILKIARKAKNALVLVDEAYGEYVGCDSTPLIKHAKNIVVVKTFSKAFGLAGLRIGYLVGSQVCVAELKKAAGPYEVNALAVAAASAALRDDTYMQAYVREVQERAKPHLYEHLPDIAHRGAANFFLMQPKDTKRTQALLREQGILVRPQGGELTGYLRVTIGTFASAKRFVTAYRHAC